jgi:histidinol-phosphate aminotransferase
MSKYLNYAIRQLEPYTPGEQPKDKVYIKLNTNENPYPPSSKVLKAIKDACNNDLRLYPDPWCSTLKKTIAEYFDIDEGQVFVGNGSDEILAFSFMAFFNPGSPILFPDITYSFYPVYSRIFNIDYKVVKLNKDFSLPEEGLLEKNGGILFPNPNAPTGRFLPVKSIETVLSKNLDSVVIIDEAYIDFGGESSLPLINKFPNLLVIQTLSKSRSLAGLRVGFAMGDRGLIEGLIKVKNSFNSYTLDRLAIVGAEAAIKDHNYFEETREKITKTRDRISSDLKEIGFKVVNSKTNFIFVTHPNIDALFLFKKLRENRILVRHFNIPKIENYLRISIGKEEEMDIFIDTIKKII